MVAIESVSRVAQLSTWVTSLLLSVMCPERHLCLPEYYSTCKEKPMGVDTTVPSSHLRLQLCQTILSKQQLMRLSGNRGTIQMEHKPHLNPGDVSDKGYSQQA